MPTCYYRYKLYYSHYASCPSSTMLARHSTKVASSLQLPARKAIRDRSRQEAEAPSSVPASGKIARVTAVQPRNQLETTP